MPSINFHRMCTMTSNFSYVTKIEKERTTIDSSELKEHSIKKTDNIMKKNTKKNFWKEVESNDKDLFKGGSIPQTYKWKTDPKSSTSVLCLTTVR